MKNDAELYIDFYSKNEASVRVSFSETDAYILNYEIALFCAFIFLQMTNLKATGVDSAIANALLEARDTKIDKFNLGDYINARDIEVRIPSLVHYRGKGNKGFYAVQNIISTPSGPTPAMTLQTIGFNILGKEINYYALQSINVLLNYFTIKYSGDPPRLYAFSDASNLCGKEYKAGNVGVGLSQGKAVRRILMQIFPKQ
jgi:hypothetical protein